MTKKILFVSEASWLSTGYSVYAKEVLSRLQQIDEFEVAELACFCNHDDPGINLAPWKVYVNKPPPDNPAYKAYKSSPVAQFGDLSFNQVLLDYKPDIVMDIRDIWMVEFEQRSPFREFFHWALMPPCDAKPQNNQWINTYDSADSIFTYSEFGRDTLLSQCPSIPFVDVASPAASDAFKPVENKEKHKEEMGISPDSFILGTVMRNQKRKLYPDLFWSFRQILDQSQKKNLYLHIHTYYPDVGWDLPELIQKHNLSSRVLMTYKCKKCNNISIDFFQNSVYGCQNCKSCTNQLVGINNSIDEEGLSKVYNIFDLYVQYANSEGFGMPQLEAAQCGVPLISINYSAMESVIKNIDAFPVEPLAYSTECETGCKRAIPNNEQFINIVLGLLDKDLNKVGKSMRLNTLKRYTWDSTADKWAKRFHEIEPKDPSTTWFSPSRIKQPQRGGLPGNLSTVLDTVNYIFEHVVCKPEWIGNHIWRRMLKDITFGYKCENMNKDFYFNESHIKNQNTMTTFSADDAYNEMLAFREQLNEWEQARLEAMGVKS